MAGHLSPILCLCVERKTRIVNQRKEIAMKTKKLFSGRWVKTVPLAIHDPICPKLRRSQAASFKALKDKKHVILKAPTGWGKTVVIAFLILYKLIKYKNLRCIIAVPQTTIAKNFTRDWKIRLGRKLIPWLVNHNLCHVSASNTVRRLISFLSDTHSSIGDRILLCTHATLAHTFKKLKKQNRLDLFKDTMLWIDEGHHIMNAQVIGGGTISNAIGALVKYCLEKGNHVGLATATYTRHDRCHIIPDELVKRFAQFYVPYDTYFKELQPVEAFEFTIVCGDLLEALDSLFKKMRPTILYLAKRNSQYASRCKYTEVRQIIKGLSKRLGKPIHRTNALIYVGDLKVLDLVTERGRDKRKEYLDNGGEADMILALDTCKEGFDWPKAERSIIIGERHSIPEMIQMIGRLFRKCKGKTHAEVFQIMPTVVNDKKKFKDWRNGILTVIFSAMLLEDVFLPIAIHGIKKKCSKKRQENLAELLPDTTLFQGVMRDFIIAAQECGDYKRSWKLAKSILKKYGVPEAKWELIWRRLWTRVNIANHRIKGLKLTVPFEFLKGVDVIDGLLQLTSGLCGIDTFAELRRVIGRERLSRQEWIVVAENLAAQNIPLQEAA